MIFAVFDPSPLTVCINCSFYIYNLYADVSVANDWQESWKYNDSENVEDKRNEADVIVDEQQPVFAVDGEDNGEKEVG